MSILIKNIQTENGQKDIYISNNIIENISDNLEIKAEKIIDGKNKAVVPSFFNGHTHLAMTLFRSLADDMALKPWLEEKIWPLEAKLTKEDVYWGTKLACLELIRSGTTFIIDMYHYYEGIAEAIEDMGIRGIISQAAFDFFNEEQKIKAQEDVIELFKKSKKYSSRIEFALGPHAIYTVSQSLLKWFSDFSKENNIKINIHLSETTSEVEDCIEKYGHTPTAYLDSIGFLNENVVAAHCLHLTDDDIAILAKRKVKVVHIPLSNMKLASGDAFRLNDLSNAGVDILLGTDGSSSSNNLDLLDVAKMVSLKQKVKYGDPTAYPAEQAFRQITETAEKISGLKIGKVQEGYLADLCLLNLRIPEMMPNHNFISNLIYSANGLAVDTVICNGKILMENRIIPGEDEILDKIPEVIKNWLSKVNEKL